MYADCTSSLATTIALAALINAQSHLTNYPVQTAIKKDNKTDHIATLL
jgi:hypothetical protein